MALQILGKLLRQPEIPRNVAAITTSSNNQCYRALIVRKARIEQEKEVQENEERHSADLVPVTQPMDISKLSGVPTEHVKERTVRIYKFSKNSMQSGTNNVGVWQMDFDTRQRWENPLMGWSSTGDPLSNMRVQFDDKDDAIQFAEKNGWKWYLDEGTPIAPKVKNYGFNFSWNKRNRVSTK